MILLFRFNSSFNPTQLCNEKFVIVNGLIQKYLWVKSVFREPCSIYLTCQINTRLLSISLLGSTEMEIFTSTEGFNVS